MIRFFFLLLLLISFKSCKVPMEEVPQIDPRKLFERIDNENPLDTSKQLVVVNFQIPNEFLDLGFMEYFSPLYENSRVLNAHEIEYFANGKCKFYHANQNNEVQIAVRLVNTKYHSDFIEKNIMALKNNFENFSTHKNYSLVDYKFTQFEKRGYHGFYCINSYANGTNRIRQSIIYLYLNDYNFFMKISFNNRSKEEQIKMTNEIISSIWVTRIPNGRGYPKE